MVFRKDDWPIYQGSLDYLCGVYAVINAMKVRKEIEHIDEAAIPFRLAMSMMNACKDWDLVGNVCFGLDEDEFPELLKLMSWRDWSEADRNPSLLRIKDALAAQKSIDTQCVLVSLIHPKDLAKKSGREPVHYTVIKEVKDDRLIIADSQLIDAIFISDAKMTYADTPVAIGTMFTMSSS